MARCPMATVLVLMVAALRPPIARVCRLLAAAPPFSLGSVHLFSDGRTQKCGQHSEQVVLLKTYRLSRARLYIARPWLVWHLFNSQPRRWIVWKGLAAVCAAAGALVFVQIEIGRWFFCAGMIASTVMVHQALSSHLRWVVLKTASGTTIAQRQKLAHEAAINLRLGFHPGLAAVFGIFGGDLVSQYVHGPKLQDIIDQWDHPPTCLEILDLMRDVVNIMLHCHQKGVAHRDLVADNIIVSVCGARIIDFGEGLMDDREAFYLDVRSFVSLFFCLSFPYTRSISSQWDVMNHVLERYVCGEVQKSVVWHFFEAFLEECRIAPDPLVLAVFEGLLDARTCFDARDALLLRVTRHLPSVRAASITMATEGLIEDDSRAADTEIEAQPPPIQMRRHKAGTGQQKGAAVRLPRWLKRFAICCS